MLLANEEFLEKLQQLFESRKSSGSVFLTEKRFTYQGPPAAALPPSQDVEMSDGTAPARDPRASAPATPSSGDRDPAPGREYPCLIRATDGKGKDAKTKLSTVVQPADHEQFSKAYGAVLKSIMATALRKKYKKKSAGAAGGSKGHKSKTTATAAGSAAAGAGAGTFASSLVKVVGPRRGAGVKKRRALVRRREKQLARSKARRKQASR